MVKIDKNNAELILISGIIGAVSSEILRFILTAPLYSSYQMSGMEVLSVLARFFFGILLIIVIGSIILSGLKNTDILDRKEWNKK